MPIKSKPFVLQCKDCSSKTTIALRSDALRPGEWFVLCPRCGSTELKLRAAGGLKFAAARLMARRSGTASAGHGNMAPSLCSLAISVTRHDVVGQGV